MIDSVERRRQVRVQHPHPLGRLGLRKVCVDRARSRPGSRGPAGTHRICGSNRASHSGSSALRTRAWMAPVHDHGNSERPLFVRPAFGMYTRLTGGAATVGCRGAPAPPAPPWPGRSSATSPSIPAVLRPALRCVTRRTLTSVFAPGTQHQLLQVAGPLARSPACVALKIRCRSRRTFSSIAAASRCSPSRAVVPGPFTRPAVIPVRVTVWRPTCPSVPASRSVRLHRLT